MAIYDNDGTANHETGKIYDNDGSAYHQIGKVYDNDGTASHLIYSSEEFLFNNGSIVPWVNVYPDGGNQINGGQWIDTNLHLQVFQATKWRRIRTSYMIDLTNVSTLYYTAYASGNGGGSGTIGISPWGDVSAWNLSRTAPYMNIWASGSTYSLDVSDITGAWYIFAVANVAGDNGNFDFYVNQVYYD